MDTLLLQKYNGHHQPELQIKTPILFLHIYRSKYFPAIIYEYKIFYSGKAFFFYLWSHISKPFSFCRQRHAMQTNKTTELISYAYTIYSCFPVHTKGAWPHTPGGVCMSIMTPTEGHDARHTPHTRGRTSFYTIPSPPLSTNSQTSNNPHWPRPPAMPLHGLPSLNH